MKQTEALFAAALGLEAPYVIEGLELSGGPSGERRLDIRIGFSRGSVFPCPEPGCSERCKVYDTAERTWRHLDFFQHMAFLTARQPRVQCPTHGVKTVTPPWTRGSSHFTLMFEAFVLELARFGMTVAKIGKLVGEHDTRLWPILQHYVRLGWLAADWSGVEKMGLDETAHLGGQKFVTVFADAGAKKRVLLVTEGRDSSTVDVFASELEHHGGAAGQVKHVSLDMSAAFAKGVREHLPEAQQTFDRFHVTALANESVDEVRRVEVKTEAGAGLKGTRWLWLKNRNNLKRRERLEFKAIKDSKLKTARAYHLREMLQELWQQADKPAAERFFRRWHNWARRSRLKPVLRLAKTLRKHLAGILAWYDSGHHTNALLEGYNSLIQAAKARARGFRSFDYARVVIYLLHGGLDEFMPSLR